MGQVCAIYGNMGHACAIYGSVTASSQGRNLALTTGGGGVESFCPAKGRGLHQMLHKRVWPADKIMTFLT